MSNLLECEACPNQVSEGKLSTVQTGKGPMKLCPSCVALHAFGKLQLSQSLSNPMLDTAAATTSNAPLEPSNTSPVQSLETKPEHHWPIQTLQLSNPQAVIEPASGKRMKQSELFTLAVTNANVKINEFDYSQDGYKQLEAWIEKLESIVFEAKTMAGVGHSKKRELDAKSGKNRWDKERANRPSSTGNLSDPREKNTYNRKKESHAKSLTKLETIVKGLIELGYSDDEIMEQCPEGKFKGHEVREAIGKMKA